MYREATIGVVIPAYNEERHIGGVLDTLPAFVDRAYVVDDGSTDRTWEQITDRARAKIDGSSADTVADGGAYVMETSQPVVVPIRHDGNRGVGAAIKTGYGRALADAIDVAVVVGGDGQMHPERILNLVDPILDGLVDYAKGNRLLDRESHRGMPSFRFVGNLVLSVLTKVASGYWKTMDPQNGFTAISREALEAIDIETMYEDYGYCNELLVRLSVAGMRVGDVTIPAVYGDEKSHIRYSRYIPRVSMLLLRNFHWRLRATYLTRDFNPLVFLYLFGALLTVGGLLAGGWATGRWLLGGVSLFTPLLASGLVLSLGVLSVLFAMVFDMLANAGREFQIDPP